MKVIHQTAELLTKINQTDVLKALELYGRNCYKSEHKITKTSHKAFIKMLLQRKHMSVLEHINLTFRLITDRGILAELTRHRLASYSVESTRYVKYNDLEVVWPFYEDGRISRIHNPKDNLYSTAYVLWEKAMTEAEKFYANLLIEKQKPQIARSVLPMSLATNIVMTANLREWLHILNLRTAKNAHPQMQELMMQVYKILNKKLPLIFNQETVPSVI
jgi:thymidylate synthase (FAD)